MTDSLTFGVGNILLLLNSISERVVEIGRNSDHIMGWILLGILLGSRIEWRKERKFFRTIKNFGRQYVFLHL